MAKKQRHSSSNTSASSSSSAAAASRAAMHHNDQPQSMSLPDEFLPSSTSSNTTPPLTLLDWIHHERQSLIWILGCAALGVLLGFGVGAGWLTRGYGTWHFVLKDPSTLTETPDGSGRVKQEFIRKFMITPWRMAMARRMRSTLLYEMITFQKAPWAILEYLTTNGAGSMQKTGDGGWFASSPMWPPNWILFRQVDLSNIEVGEGGLSPTMMKFLSLVLPWRRNLIKALARKEKRVTLRDADGNLVDDSDLHSSSPNSFVSRIKGLLYGSKSAGQKNAPVDAYYHPMGFYALREYVVRFDHGYVHPDLGFLIPAPSGAARGIGMVRDSYTKCQRNCFPGTAKEREEEDMVERKRVQEIKDQQMAEQEIMDEMKRQFPELSSDTSEGGEGSSLPPRPSPSSTQHKAEHQATSTTKPYSQHELLLHIPLEAQITRSTAVEMLKNILPEEVMKNQIAHLDDAFVLTILLAHERGLGDGSRFFPYIATLPPRPTCALNPASRQSVVDVVTALSVEMGTDVVGWPNEISKAAEVAERIVSTFSAQYKIFVATPPGINFIDSLRWALCHVASRAVAGREAHGRLRLVPMMDLINHDEAADKFYEVVGNETSNDPDGFALHAEENDAGAFIVRSRRHGRSKPLKKGQELMANYNVPKYSPLDWFINMGFVPPERTGKWTMLESGLPPNYRGGFSRKSTGVTGVGAFGSGKPEIQVLRQYTTQSAAQQQQHQQSPQVQQSQQQAQQQQTCQR
mmetsp:Transcript_4384/g.7577  ORF Transcript_4384/g.7577 Transcript_4384/m.7577 type:complete len:744 (+) Transcript_4384:68-2299(+)